MSVVLITGCTVVDRSASDPYSETPYETHVFRIGLERRLMVIEENLLIESPERYYLVSGAVRYPGLFEVWPGSKIPIKHAIAKSFGLRDLEGTLYIQVRRFDHDTGKWRILESWTSMSEAEEFKLQAGDQLLIHDVVLSHPSFSS